MFKKAVNTAESLVVFAQHQLTNKQFLFLSSVLVGISSAFAVIVLKSFAHWVFEYSNYATVVLKVGFVKSIFPIIGILLTVLVVKKVLGGTIEKGTSQILYAVAKRASIIPKKQMYAQIITSSLTVGFGGSAGLESPIVITGAAFGSNYAQKYKLSYKDRTLLIGCGVAAGIGAAFNAPIAGVLFAIEVLLVDVSIAAFTPIMISAATGALTSAIILNDDIILNFEQQQKFDFHNTFYYVLLGLFAGFIAVFYTRNFQKTESIFSRLKFKPFQKALFGATILALLIFIFPTLFGEGYESIKILSANDPGRILENTVFSSFRNNSWILLLFVGATMLIKAFATGITLGSGGNGGNFAPSLFLGSYVGFFFSKLINMLGITNLPTANFTLVGMAGILSALFHAPLTAIFLIAEITGGYNLMIPLMIVSSISFAVSKRFEKHSLDLKKLAKKGDAFTSNKDANVLSTINIEQITIKNGATLSPSDKLDKLVNLLAQSQDIVFAVVDNEDKLLGTVHFNDIRPIIFNDFKVKYTTVSEIMTIPTISISTLDTMTLVMSKFETSNADFLPIINGGKYYGLASKAMALNLYRTNLQSLTID